MTTPGGAGDGPPVPSFLPGPATTAPLPLAALARLLLHRPGGRRAVSGIVGLLVVAGVGLLATPAITDAIAWWHQQQLRGQLASPRLRTLYRDGRIPVGADLTELHVHNARVSIDVVVVQGTTAAALRAGAGHYVGTPLPCARGNVGIAGHRTTYGRPFNRLDDLRAGDLVRLDTPLGHCTYRVVPGFAGHANPWVVEPDDVGVVAQTAALARGHWLTLTSCNPPGSATQRIVLRARLVSATVGRRA